MVRVAVYGASGDGGLELLRLLARHPSAEVTALATRQIDAPHISQVHASLTGLLRPAGSRTSRRSIRSPNGRTCAFACLPHGRQRRSGFATDRPWAARSSTSAPTTGSPDRGGLRAVVRCRLTPDPERIGANVAYGLAGTVPRLESARRALVANPGCYPTSAILALAPLLQVRG